MVPGFLEGIPFELGMTFLRLDIDIKRDRITMRCQESKTKITDCGIQEFLLPADARLVRL